MKKFVANANYSLITSNIHKYLKSFHNLMNILIKTTSDLSSLGIISIYSNLNISFFYYSKRSYYLNFGL